MQINKDMTSKATSKHPCCNWLESLLEKFPPDQPNEQKKRWENLPNQLKPGDVVHGEVVCSAPFGTWMDIGAGFPALLHRSPGNEPMQYHAVGTKIIGKVKDFDGADKRILLMPFDM